MLLHLWKAWEVFLLNLNGFAQCDIFWMSHGKWKFLFLHSIKFYWEINVIINCMKTISSHKILNIRPHACIVNQLFNRWPYVQHSYALMCISVIDTSSVKTGDYQGFYYYFVLISKLSSYAILFSSIWRC